MPEHNMKRLFGSDNTYIKIGKRQKDEIYLSMIYAVHPLNGVGGLLVRFISTADPDKFSHLSPREITNLKDDQHNSIKVTRLNKVFIPVFKKGPTPFQFLVQSDKVLVWEIFSEWVYERLKADNFELDLPSEEKDGQIKEAELKEILKDLVTGKFDNEDDNNSLIMEMPSFEKVEKES